MAFSVGTEPIRRVIHNSAIRQVLSETEEFVPSRVLLTLFQRDRIFGRDRSFLPLAFIYRKLFFNEVA
jgi:hypothetical protein